MKTGMGKLTNNIMTAVPFKLADVLRVDQALTLLKDATKKTHKNMTTIMFYADFIGAVAKAAQQPYSLTRQVAYRLVYGSRREIRQKAIAKSNADDPLAVLQTSTHKSYVASAGLAPDFRLERSIPIPTIVAAATGAELCRAVARYVEWGSHSIWWFQRDALAGRTCSLKHIYPDGRQEAPHCKCHGP